MTWSLKWKQFKPMLRENIIRNKRRDGGAAPGDPSHFGIVEDYREGTLKDTIISGIGAGSMELDATLPP